MINYTGICLSSGGIKGVIMLGALNYLYMQDKNILKDIKYYAGTSVGSIIAMLLSIGYTPMEMLVFACNEELNKAFANINLLNITNIHGIYNNTILKYFLEDKIKQKLDGKSPTFSEYYRQSGKYLVVPVYCLSETVDKRKIYCSPDDTPDMKIIDAVILSCNIPVIFEKALFNDKVYIDGAYTSNFPVEPLKERIGFNENCDDFKILGIAMIHNNFNLNNLMDYILAIQSIPLVEQEKNYDNDKNLHLLKLSSPEDISVINFKLTSSKKSDLFNMGYFQAQKILGNDSAPSTY